MPLCDGNGFGFLVSMSLIFKYEQNCTTACNIQAALQYVELTHVSSSASSLFFFCICFVLQKCACSSEQVPKSCFGLAVFPLGGVLLAERRSSIGDVTRIGLIGCFHIRRYARSNTGCHSYFPLSLFSKPLDKEMNGTGERIVDFFPLFLTTCFSGLFVFFKKLNFLL